MTLLEELDIYIKIQNIQLLKLIAYEQDWDFIKLLKFIY